MKTLLLDNYDSFTYNLYDYILQCGVECAVLRNDETDIHYITAQKFDNIILSPGPKEPMQAGIMMEVIEKLHLSLPILGICLGHQALGMYFGMELVKLPEPRHGKTSPVIHNNSSIFNKTPSPFEVMRYHSLTLSKQHLPKHIEILAQTTDDEQIMSINHKELPLVGLQFHPEAILTENGLQLMRNWFQSIEKVC